MRHLAIVVDKAAAAAATSRLQPGAAA